MKPVEKIVRQWLATEYPDAHVGTDAPAKITGPTIRITRSGGGSNLTLDQPDLEVDCWDLTKDNARTLAEQVRDSFIRLAHTTVETTAGDLAVTQVKVSMGPRWLPWDNTTVRRYAASYALWCV